MKTKKGFRLRNICGENIIVAEGVENIDFSRIISMNESSAYLWKKVEGQDFTEKDLTNYLTEEYIGFTSGFIHGDEIIISTIAGQLRAECRRTNYGTINLLKYLADGSKWLKMKFGENAFSMSTTNNTNQYVSGTISHTNQYLGV